MFIDYDKLDEELKRLEQECEEYRRERVAKGLPPDPPEPFVPVAHAILLCERVEPVFRFLIKYAKLTFDANQLIPFDVSQFDKYERDLILLRHSKGFLTGFWGKGILQCIDLIKRVTEAVNKGETEAFDPFIVAKFIYEWIELMGGKVPVIDTSFELELSLDYEAEEKEQTETRAELERLRADEAAFAAEVEEYWRYYESIKHLF
ncbi:hypothetical protein PTHTG4_09900 [Parageobacillus thermoglucosidasius]|uniref:hypothetical protein n=1 Tax=Parageobacillus thermoglucosidasius TaxID=1426 RepID=UPI000F623661|nr:hypothetical protein [Parageobacillus thermoglucosidasius]GCD81928.1 hypothetical protein PTHTG4_09900 [Parageobacillus thermoglucosidasius]